MSHRSSDPKTQLGHSRPPPTGQAGASGDTEPTMRGDSVENSQGISGSPPEVDTILLLTRRWRTMAVFGTAGLAVAVVYVLLAPKWYQAHLTVVPSQRSKDVTSALASSLPLIGGIGGSMLDDLQRIEAVLSSHSVADAVIKKFDLMSRYDTEYVELAREALWTHCSVTFERKSVVVQLMCEDREPARARDMAKYFGQVGNQTLGRISVSSASEERRFLEAQVIRARKEVDDASEKLRWFQETYHVIDLVEQSKAVISAMASLQGQLLSKQLELDYVRGFSSRTEAGVLQLREQIRAISAQIARLEAGQIAQESASAAPTAPSVAGAPAVSSSGGKAPELPEHQRSFFPGAMDVPALRVEFEQLFRQQKVQETLFLLLTQRLEMARVDEARDTSTFQILDQPTTPTYRSRPQFTKVALLGLLFGLAAAGAWVLGPAWWRRRTQLSGARG